MNGMNDHTNTVSPGRVLMTMCCLPTRLPSSLLVCAGLRYMRKETAERRRESSEPGDGLSMRLAECGFT